MALSRKPERKPRLACQISSQWVIAARANQEGHALEAASSRTLAPGTVTPSLTGVNVTDSNALSLALQDVLSVAGGHGKDVIAVVPDATCRVSLLDFDSLPQKPQEAEAVVRYRLKKSLPFDLDKARVSFSAQPSLHNQQVRVVATVALISVLEEYEAAVREAGVVPGIVLPATLAALGNVDASRPTLVLNVESWGVTVAIVGQEQLLLYRTLENRAGTNLTGQPLADDVYASVVFFQDTYGVNIERVLVSGVAAEQIGSALHEYIGLQPEDLVGASQASSDRNARPLLGALVGALVS